MFSFNLIFPNINNPAETVQYNGIYSKINTGLAYHSFQNKIKIIGNSVIIPLIFFIDGTAIDHAGRHSQTPVMFTLGIFNQCLRNISNAWYNIGFEKNNVREHYSQQQINVALKGMKKYAKNHPCFVPEKHKDFHMQIQCIFYDLLCIQAQKNGIQGTFTIDGNLQTKEY